MVKFSIIAAIVIVIAIIILILGIWNFTLPHILSPINISITFDKSSYEPNTAAKITVIDPSANTNNATREKILVQVTSDSDSVGIPVQLEEYRVNSDKFVTHPYLV